MILGLEKPERRCTLRMKCLIISSATSKSAMTPSRMGRIASMEPGVRPEHQLGVLADGEHLLDAVLDVVGDDRRLGQHDARGPSRRPACSPVPRSIAMSDEKRLPKPNMAAPFRIPLGPECLSAGPSRL
jgi:hypothetical protein